MRKIRTYNEVDHGTGSQLLEQVLEQRARLQERLASVGRVVAVASGKGGVGKSAVTANLAGAMAAQGLRVGVLDADLNGPSLARMLQVRGRPLEDRAHGVVPPTSPHGVKVFSMELLQGQENAPLRWKEPETDTFLWQSSMETTALREFLADVEWGELDFLLVDVPPGTDKIRRLLELVPDPPVALIVSTPAEISRAVVLRSIGLIREAEVPAAGIVANMTEYLCPDCGHRGTLFRGDGIRRLAEESGLNVWARIPFDPSLGEETDAGAPPAGRDPEGLIGRAFAGLVDRLREAPDGSERGPGGEGDPGADESPRTEEPS